MKEGDLPITQFAGYGRDFRAEVTAAEMMELGVSPERIVILMLGALKRSLRKDVESIEEEASDYDHEDYVVIRTPKEGLYDMLPEGLFHQPAAHKTTRTATEVIAAIKKRKEEEHDARRFFIPFEAAINYLRMQFAFYENCLDRRSEHQELVNIFEADWDIFQYLDAKQSNLFLHLLPILHDIRDNYPVVETILEMMLDIGVRLQLRRQQPFRPSEPVLSMMGESRLGVDLTTGNEVFDEGVDEILISIGPVTGEAFRQFSTGGTKQKILELLIDSLLPANLDIVTEFELNINDKRTKLALPDDYLNSVLGSDTYL